MLSRKIYHTTFTVKIFLRYFIWYPFLSATYLESDYFFMKFLCLSLYSLFMSNIHYILLCTWDVLWSSNKCSFYLSYNFPNFVSANKNMVLISILLWCSTLPFIRYQSYSLLFSITVLRLFSVMGLAQRDCALGWWKARLVWLWKRCALMVWLAWYVPLYKLNYERKIVTCVMYQIETVCPC